MNSMLQCLSNTEPLTRYFVSAQFRAHINTNNVLGTGVRGLDCEYSQFVCCPVAQTPNPPASFAPLRILSPHP